MLRPNRRKTKTCAAEGCGNQFAPKVHNAKYCCRWCREHRRCCVDCGTRITRLKHRCRSCAMNRPEVRAQKSAWAKSMWENPKHKANISEKMREHWQDAEHRATRIAAMKDAGIRHGVRANRRMAAKSRWQDPEQRETHAKLMEDLWQDPELRATRIATLKQAGSRPEFRAKMSEVAKEVHSRPDVKAKVRAASRANWQDPDYVERWYAGMAGTDGFNGDKYVGFDTVRPLIRQRDKGICKLCSRSPDIIDIHHIDVDTNNQLPHNLISLMRPLSSRNNTSLLSQRQQTRDAIQANFYCARL